MNLKIWIFVITLCLNVKADLFDFSSKIYTIQVFSSKDKQLSKDYLKDYDGYNNLFIWPKVVKKEIWFRSCVNIFFNKESANIELEKIKKQRPEAFIIEFVSN